MNEHGIFRALKFKDVNLNKNKIVWYFIKNILRNE